MTSAGSTSPRAAATASASSRATASPRRRSARSPRSARPTTTPRRSPVPRRRASSVKLYTNSTCTSAVVGTGDRRRLRRYGHHRRPSPTTARRRSTRRRPMRSTTPRRARRHRSSYTEDSTPPPLPSITGGPSGATSDDTPSWTFTTSGGTIQCRLLEGATEIAAWSAVHHVLGPDLSASHRRAVHLRGRARSTPRRTRTPVSRTITLNRSHRRPRAHRRSGTTTNDITPTWAWTAEASADARRAASTRDRR